MGDTEEAHMDMMHRIQSSFGKSSSAIPRQHLTAGSHQPDNNVAQLNPANMRAPMRHFGSFGAGSGKRIGIPPSRPHQSQPVSPYSQIPVSCPSVQQLGSQGGGGHHAQGPSHSRSLSQPCGFFPFDSLPPLSPSPYRDSNSAPHGHQVSGDVTMEVRGDSSPHLMLPPSPYGGDCNRVGEGLPPRKAHRRSNSDIPFGFSLMQSSPPPRPPYTLERSMSGGDKSGTSKPAHMVKREFSWNGGDGTSRERKSEGEVIDDLFSAYLNLDNIDTLNSSETDEKNGFGSREDLLSGASGTNTVGSSDNEAESSAMGNDSAMSKLALSGSQKREGMKRSAAGDIAPTTRHYRSVSMDSFMGSMHFGNESPTLSPSAGPGPGKLSPCNSLENNNSNSFSLEFGNGDFSGAELKKIMANDKLAEIAATDPKRVKRILANRQSAARSKERKMRYISELEHKVQTLQTEATTLSAQLTLLQRDSSGLTSQNNELKFRLQAMEQQAKLRDALNEALSAEVQRLKITYQELRGETPNGVATSQHSINQQMFQKSQQQAPQPPQQKQQQNVATKNP